MLEDATLEPLASKLVKRCPLNDAEQSAILLLPHQVRRLDRQQYISREGSHSGNCEVLLSGFAYTSRTARDGARAVLAIHMVGEILDIPAGGPEASSDVQALSSARVASIPSEALLALADAHPRIGVALWRLAMRNASVLSEWLLNVGRRDARGRLAHLLCEIATRQQANGTELASDYAMPLTQEQLGDSTGLTAVHVNRVLGGLRRDGIIELRGGRMSISDWNALKSAGDFRPAYLQL